MAINFSEDLYLKCWAVFARPMTVTPFTSSPGAPAYDNRCYFDTKETDVLTDEGAIYSDARTFIDIRMEEFVVLPMQGDRIDIPYHEGSPGGTFEVSDLGGDGNAGGIITLTLKKLVTANPPYVG